MERRPVRWRWTVGAWALVFAALAAGCEGGGPAPSTGHVPPTRAQGAEPGQLVSLAATRETSDPKQARYRWHQIGGAPVELTRDSSAIAYFVMPRLAPGEELDFVVEVQSATNEVRQELHSVISTEPRTATPACATIAPDFAVFEANKDLPDRTDLYLTRLDGSGLFRLNGPLLPGTWLGVPLISPDRRYVSYYAEESTPVWTLHVARTDGGGEVQVSSVRPPRIETRTYAWAPDGSRIAYVAGDESHPALYTVRPDGSDTVKVSGPLVDRGSIWEFKWAPDSSRLAYSADQYTVERFELFTVRPDGTDHVRVSGGEGVEATTHWTGFKWAPDSSRIAYLGHLRDPTAAALFTTRPDGSENARISVSGLIEWRYEWAPDATRIAYVATQLDPGKQELFSSWPDGTGNTQVSGPVLTRVDWFAWSPDSAWIAYGADHPTGQGLFVSGPDGSSYHPISDPTLLNPDLVGWSPDSSRLAFRAEAAPGGSSQLYTVRPDGSGEVRVSGPVEADATVFEAAWDSTSSRIAFRAGTRVHGPTQESWGHFRLYTSAADGTQRVALSPDSGFADVTAFAWTSDGRRLVYEADQYVDEQFELFVAGPTGDTVNARISGPLVDGGSVGRFLVP